MANSYEYELGTSPHPPDKPASAAAKFGVFIVVVATIAAGAWFYVSRSGSGPAAPETAAAAAEPAPAATDSSTPATSPAPGASPTPGASPAPTASPAPPRRPRPRATVPAEPATITPAPVASPPPPPPASAEPVKPTTPSPAPERAASASRPPAPKPDLATYDSATADVTPPFLLTAIDIAPVRTNYVPGLATIEVIVGRDGSVQSANAGRPPATLGETLEMINWLSAAKSWAFGPALRNGQPVKYRLVVPLSALVSGRGIR